MIPTATPAPSVGSVTVLIAVYNGARFIRRALDSVRRQTLRPLEVLVVDDGSTDGTAEVIETEYPEVLLLRQQNFGVSNARNLGLQRAQGTYIAMLDADDWWADTKLQRQADLLAAQPDVVATYTALTAVLGESGSEVPGRAFPANRLWPWIRWENPSLAPSSVMVRRSALEEVGGFDPTLRTSEDWDLWFRLLQRGRFAEISGPLTFYRSSADGISGDAVTMFHSFEAIRERRLLSGFSGLRRAIWRRRITSYQAFKACLTARGADDRSNERSFMWRSLREWPSPFWHPKRFKYFAVTLLRR